MWSAAADPRVVSAHVEPQGPDRLPFDGSREAVRRVRDGPGEHLLIERGGMLLRLDIVQGRTDGGPVALRFDLADDIHLKTRIAALEAFTGIGPWPCRHARLARRLLALQAYDARASGCSLSRIAEMLLGKGDWPGEGDHRKSLVRRLVAGGERMVRAGPRAVLETTRT